MDQELVAYFDERFREVREELRQEIQSFREETAQQFQEAREETAQQFREAREETAQQFREAREETAQQFRGAWEETAQQFRGAREESNRRFERVEEEIRHTQVLVEAGRGDIRMVAEGTYGLDERLGSFRKEVQQEFEDVRKLIRPVYSSLDQRIRTLEVRKDLQGRDPIELIKERFGLGQKTE